MPLSLKWSIPTFPKLYFLKEDKYKTCDQGLQAIISLYSEFGLVVTFSPLRVEPMTSGCRDGCTNQCTTDTT